MSGGVSVRGGKCPGGICPWSKCPGGKCPVFFCPVTVKNIQNTGVETLVSMTTKIIELLIFQKMTKHVLDVIS